MSTLVSVIIPVYNRSHLIGETLDSIIEQTYANWECVLVDDGSSDATVGMIERYIDKDARFKLFFRPETRPKGANACRNIGLEKAMGAYIVFFDSDDLMAPNHLETKMATFQNNPCDFVVSQTRFFNNDLLNHTLERQYDYSKQDISIFNYVSHKVNWLTYDTCIKAEVAKRITFNEQLQSGQEYNYYSKLLLETNRCIFIKDVLTLRRYHEQSIRGGLRDHRYAASLSYFYTYWYTYQDIKDRANERVRQFLLYRCYRMLRKLPKAERTHLKEVYRDFYRELGGKGLYYALLLELKQVKG